MLEKLKSRAAYRAVYLSSPLKFHTTLHAFARPGRVFYIDPWKKDIHAWEKHKLRSRKQRERGRWFYSYGPLDGVQLDGWPEPNLLGASALVQVASRAQEERLQDRRFWEQVGERAYNLRDVLPVSELAAVLDALVSADFRHQQLLKTATREIIDDADKMPLDEIAVVANAYAHFRCLSVLMMDALASQAASLLVDDPLPYVLGAREVDIGSVSVLLRSFATLGHKHAALLSAAGEALRSQVGAWTLPMIMESLAAFVKLGHNFEGDADFWQVVASKVPGGRMATLCPLLRASAFLGASEPTCRDALVGEISKGLRDAPSGGSRDSAEPVDDDRLLSGDVAPAEVMTRERLPPFAPSASRTAINDLLLRSKPQGVFVDTDAPASVANVGSIGVQEDQEFSVADAVPILEQTSPASISPILVGGGTAVVAGESSSEVEEPKPRGRRIGWYNNVSRCPSLPANPRFVDFSPSDAWSRNRRGARTAEALEGLRALWHRSASSSSHLSPASGAEAELALLAAPVLLGALQGLSASQLAACAEVYAACSPVSDEGACRAAMHGVVRESIRKLSNFTPQELKRLRSASLRIGLSDPYLERARRRRFPKALRKELRDEDSASAGGGPSGAARVGAPASGAEATAEPSAGAPSPASSRGGGAGAGAGEGGSSAATASSKLSK